MEFLFTSESIGCPKILCPVCVVAVEELQGQFSPFLHSFIGYASNKSLRPSLSQSDQWLLIYGRENAK